LKNRPTDLRIVANGGRLAMTTAIHGRDHRGAWPDDSPEQVQAEVVRRLPIAQRLDEAGVFQAADARDP
jgi:hypothetical protein